MSREKRKAAVSLDVSMGTTAISNVLELLAFLDKNGNAVLHYLSGVNEIFSEEEMTEYYNESVEAQVSRKIKEGKMTTKKDSNPKRAMGIKKVSMHTVPVKPLLELALALGEGGHKYGTHNYRDIGVRASTYYAAAMRHLMAYWEGEDIDPESNVHHVVKAIACMFVLRDSQHMNNCTDDRPIQYPNGINMAEFNEIAEALLKMYPESATPFLQTTHAAPKITPAPAETFKDSKPLVEPADQKLGKVPKYFALAMGTPVKIVLQKGCRATGVIHRCRKNGYIGWYKEPYMTGSKLHTITLADSTKVNLYEGEFKAI